MPERGIHEREVPSFARHARTPPAGCRPVRRSKHRQYRIAGFGSTRRSESCLCGTDDVAGGSTDCGRSEDSQAHVEVWQEAPLGLCRDSSRRVPEVPRLALRHEGRQHPRLLQGLQAEGQRQDQDQREDSCVERQEFICLDDEVLVQQADQDPQEEVCGCHTVLRQVQLPRLHVLRALVAVISRLTRRLLSTSERPGIFNTR